MAFAVAVVFSAGAAFWAASIVFELAKADTAIVADKDVDSVGASDPNDCSRGVDESNQESCDGGAE